MNYKNIVYVLIFCVVLFEGNGGLAQSEEAASQEKPFTKEELEKYYQWLPERISGYKVTPGEKWGPQIVRNNIGSDRSASLAGGGHLVSDKLVCIFSFNFERSVSHFQPFAGLSALLRHKLFSASYFFEKDNIIFPFLGSFYCCDIRELDEGPDQNGPSAFRIADRDVPRGVSLRRVSIVIPLMGKGTYAYDMLVKHPGIRYNCVYDDCRIAFIDFGTTVEDQLYVKRVRNDWYTDEGIIKRDAKDGPFTNTKDHYHQYKIGDVMYFNTLGHRIINIVLPDTEDYRTVFRTEENGKKTRLKGGLMGWVELDPNPLPFDAEAEKKTLVDIEPIKQ